MRDATLADAKSTLRAWFRERDDAYLSRVVDDCRSGKFAMWDSCHCLRGLHQGGMDATRSMPQAIKAERALYLLAPGDIPARFLREGTRHDGHVPIPHCEATRRARVLPIALAEIRHRNREAAQSQFYCREHGEAWTIDEDGADSGCSGCEREVADCGRAQG